MKVSITEMQHRLSHWLKEIPQRPITITRRGKPVGVLIAPEEYARLRQARAYLEMVRLSHALRVAGVTAEELFEASRASQPSAGGGDPVIS